MGEGQPSCERCRFDASTTRAEALAVMKRAFAAAGVDTPDLDARLLLCGVLGIDAARLITEPGIPLGEHAAALAAASDRRIRREPVSRILGRRDFYGRTFEVTPATLDPRPDTETLIDTVLGYVRLNGGREVPWRILDVGTGTGCLLVTLLAELPNATGIGSDISPEALQVAIRNAGRIGVADRSQWIVADGLDGISGQFDIVVSNPPYIATAAIAGLDAEVRAFDPILALDGGGDGLDFYRRLITGIVLVFSDGCVVFEIGFDQADPVVGLLRAEGRDRAWPLPEVVDDLSGHARCVSQTTRR